MIAALRRFARRLINAVRPSAREADLERELLSHVAIAEDEHRLLGRSPDEARLAARRVVGSIAYAKDLHRDARSFVWVDDVRRDLRGAVRNFARMPGFSMVAVLTMALGIGANTAIFSIVNGLLLRPLPVERPDRLVLLLSNPSVNPSSPWSNPVWEQIRDHHADLFDSAFAFSRRMTRFNLAPGGQTDAVDGVYVSGRYFEGLGVRPVLGRPLLVSDDRRGGGQDGPVAVISYALWQRRFGGSADVVGKTQLIDRVPFVIVGVMPSDFFGTDVGSRSDVLLPIATEPLIRGRDSTLDRVTASTLLVMARLKDGQTVASAEQAFRAAQPDIRQATMPSTARAEVRARYLATPFGLQPIAGGPSAMRGRYRQPILIIMAIAALVLLIACANVANLYLARGAARRHEFSVYLALGASRWQLARQQLIESMLLAAIGSAAGVAMARWASDLLVHQVSTQAATVFLDTRLDWRVLAFTTVVAIAVALLFGVAPALRAARTPPIEVVRTHGGTGVEHGLGLGGALVAGQIASSLVLIVAAGLFIRTFVNLATLSLGFDRDAVLLVRLEVPPTTAASRRVALYEQLAATVRAARDVSHAAISEITPVSGMITDVYVEADNGPALAPPQNVAYKNVITPDWFATYGTRLESGRDFDERDERPVPPVAIVNETFVRRFLPGGSPLGRRIRNPSPVQGEQAPWMEVVGVVADATYLSLRDAVPPTMYVPLAQQDVTGSFSFVTLSVRAANGRPLSLVRAVSEAVTRIGSDIAITFVPLGQQVDDALVQERLIATLSGSFGVLALLLSAVGLYGLTAYTVNRQRTELGIRMAIGATGARVIGIVLARIMLLFGIGVVIGAAASIWVSKFVASLVYGVQLRDPVTLIGAAVTLAIVCGLAGWSPAWRASRLDPAEVLRES